jgi:predicted cupin superfamily sugar epimerase
MDRANELKKKYSLERHPEGGWFSEVYTSPFEHGTRAFMGSIYFLLEGDDMSHFHQIDCDEIWYHHEGCALKITLIIDGNVSELIIGAGEGHTAMAVIPKGAIFAAENLEKTGYCFMSCATTPKFTYDGFILVDDAEIASICPSKIEGIRHLAFTKEEIGDDNS